MEKDLEVLHHKARGNDCDDSGGWTRCSHHDDDDATRALRSGIAKALDYRSCCLCTRCKIDHNIVQNVKTDLLVIYMLM